MLKNILNLLILCDVLCQGILGSVADEDIKKPSYVLVRHKRVFYSNSSRSISTLISSIEHSPYVVNIKTKIGNIEVTHCVGVILAAHAIITAQKCAGFGIKFYSVYSGASFSTDGTHHSVIGKKIHFNSNFKNEPYSVGAGIALMFVNPHFVFTPSTRPIVIHRAPIEPHSIGTISGWGYHCTKPVVPEPLIKIRSITVSTLTNEDCGILWESMMQITPNDICTYDTEKHCGHTDAGAPLVVDGQLVGIHLISGGLRAGFPARPDIFALLQQPEYFNWISANIDHSM